MSWKVREEGSPRFRDGLSLEQVFEDLEEGEWGPTDEVRGPDDRDWTRFESHPKFADAVALEPLPRSEDEETHIDMTPIIDVAMVLLVFFILIFTYSVLEKRLEAAKGDAVGPPVLAQKDVKEQMIEVTITRENGTTVYRVQEDPKPVPPDQLEGVLSGLRRSTGHAICCLEAAADVPSGDVIYAKDQATGAGMNKVMEALLKQKKP